MLKEKKSSILVIGIMCIVIAMLVVSFMFNQGHEEVKILSTNEISSANTSTWSNGYGLASKGDGLEDGQVPSGYSNTSGTNYSSNPTQISGSTNYYMSSDATLTISSLINDESSTYSGTFDGCGHTLTINSNIQGLSEDIQQTETVYRSAFCGVLSGTIKNVTIVIDGSTSGAVGFHSGGYRVATSSWHNSGDLKFYYGFIAHTLNGGTIQNVKIIYRPNSKSFITIRKGYAGGFQAGFAVLVGVSKGGNIKNTTLDVEGDVELAIDREESSKAYWGFAFFVGGSESGTTSITACSLEGSGNLEQTKWGNSGSVIAEFGLIGGIVNDGTLNINGFDFGGWTGSFVHNNDSGNVGIFYGQTARSSGSIKNIFYRSSSGFASVKSSLGTWYTGSSNGSFTPSNMTVYSIAYTNIGFCHSDTSKMWVGELTSYSGSGNSTTGSFTSSIKMNGTTYETGSFIAYRGINNRVVPTIAVSSVTTDISAYTKGSYAYANPDMVNTISGGPSFTKTSSNSPANTYTGTYNGTAVSSVSSVVNIYRAGSKIKEYSIPSWNSSPSGSVKDIGTYTYSYNYSSISKYNSSEAQGFYLEANEEVSDYYVLLPSGSAFSVQLNITRAPLTISSSSYTGTYDGNSHNITINGLFSNSGYVNGETLSSLLSSGYATVSVGSLSGTSVTENNFNNLAITSVSDSVKSIPISISFTNYSINNANSYSKTETITINPVNLTITTSDYSNSYDGAIHGIQTTGNIILNNEIQSSGYVNGETLASIIQNGKGSFSVSYNSVADTTPNTTISGVDAVNGYSSLAISHVKDSVRTIQINLSLVDYTINSTSHDFTSTNTITITPASLTLDETIVKDYEYSGYSLYENSAITDRGYEFYNSVLQAAQTSGSPGLSLLNYDQMIQNRELTFTSSATTVLDVNSYTFTVQASSSSTGSAEADFTLQGEHTFSYNITKGTTILSITLIGNSDVSTYTGTSNTATGSKVYNDQNEPIPTANITLNNGGKSLGEATKTVLKDNSTYYLENAKKAGVYKVTYNFAGTNNYEAVKLVYTYTIDKATTYIEFTTIGDKLGAGVSKQVTSGSFSESKKFDFDAVTIPTAYVRWYTGNDGSTGVREETISYTSTASIQPGSNVSDAGVYDITWSYSGGDNLTACSCTYTYTIEKNTITFGFANSTGSQQLQSYALSVSTLLGSSYGNLNATLKNSKGQTIQVITAGVSQKSKVSLTSSSTCTSLYPGEETSFTGTEVQDCGTYKLIYSMTTSDTNYTVTTNPATYTFTISQRRMYLQFNDTKDLYDSIIDTTGNYYDFIFVSGADNISKINSVAQDYSSYFTKIVEWGSGVGSGHNFKDYLTLTAGVTSSTSVGNYYFSVEWNESATNKTVLNRLRNNYKAGVLDSSNVVIGTTGSGYSAGYTSYCESAKNTNGFNAAAADSSYEIRIRMVSGTDTKKNVTLTHNNDWSILDTGDKTNIITFINGHYYDSDEYASATSATITSQVWINRAFDGSRIMASYKTLNGNSNTCEMKMWHEVTSSSDFDNGTGVTAQITSKGVYTHASDASTSETGYTGTYDQGYPAYTIIDGEKYYAGASLVALNYGVIKGFTFKWYVEGLDGHNWRSPRLTIEGHHNRNSAVGTISGINCGYITGCKIYYQRLLTFKGTSSSYNFAAGLDVGINNGYMSNNTFEFVENTEDDTKSASATHKYRVHFGMVGVASSGYFGLVCGINGSKGTIENITKEGTNVPFSVEDFTGTIYGGGFVGKNAGILNNLSFTNIASTLDTVKDSAWTSSFDSDDGPGTYPFKGYELRFYASADVYAGGIVGYSTGEINNCKYNSGTSTSDGGNLLATAGSGNTIALGGIVGYIGGGGKVNACSVKNYGCIYAGSDSVIVNAYALGGVVGVSSGGEIDGSSISNYGTIFGRASGAGNNYAGCFLGIGCEDGNGTTSAATYTSSNRVKFGTTNVEPGVFTASTSFNYGTIGANWGSWGYITGKYNTILSDSISDGYDYAHTYGGLIWYTNNTPSKHTKCLFGSVASILGDNGTNSSTNVYITGIAGINIGDCGDGTLGNQLLDNVSLNTETGEINISYNSISNITQTNAGSASFYYGMDASVNGNTVYITPNGGSKVAYTDNLGAGVFTMSTADANAIITDTTVEATISTVRVRTYLYIGSYEEYKDFVQNTGSSNYSVYRYCAGYGTLSTSMETGSIVWSGVLNEYKTFDGANKTITYTTNAAVSVSAVSGNWNGKNIYVLGTLLGANNGYVKSVNIVVTTSADNSYFIFDTVSGVNNVYGVVAGANSGVIEYCNVTIKGGDKVGLTASSSTSGNRYSIGGIAGVSSSSITHCNVKFENNTRLGLMSGTYTNGSYAAVGGIVGAQFGSEVSNCAVVGKGYILTENSTSSDIVSNPNGYVGGIGGYLLVAKDNRDLTYMGLNVGVCKVYNVVVALFGGIESASTSYVDGSTAAGVGGTGYISGKGTAFENSSSYDTLKTLNLGACFIIGTGEPTAVDWKAAAVQNTIFGGVVYNEHATDKKASNKEAYVEMYWYDIPGIAFLSLNDYSIRGKGVAEMVSSASIYVTFPTTFFESNISAGGITIYFYNQSNGKVKLSLTSLALTVNSNATYINTVITNISKDGEGTPTSSDQGTSTSTSLGGYTAVEGTSVMLKLKVSYSVSIAEENIEYDSATSLVQSPFYCFISGRGNGIVYAGAKEAALTGNITYDKKVSAAIEFAEGKVLNGNGNTFYSYWSGRNESEGGNYVAGLTDGLPSGTWADNGYDTVGGNRRESKDYPYWYELNGKDFYGVSDLISINRGTIKNLNISYRQEEGKTHDYAGMNADTAYGAIAGINLGTIENCIVVYNCTSVYIGGGADYTLVMGAAVGINKGTIKGLTVNMASSFTLSGSIGNNLFSSGVGINYGDIYNIDIVNTAGVYLTATSDGNSSTVAGGIVAINNGGSIKYARISGEGQFKIGTYTKNTTETPTEVEVTDENGNKITVTTTVTTTSYTYSTKYLYFAVGIAISNNGSEEETLPGLVASVASCIKNNDNPVDHIIIDYGGDIYAYAQNYMTGIAFAHAGSSTTAEGDLRYGNIFWNSDYNTNIALAVESTGGTNLFQEGTIASAGFPLMGYTGNTNKGDFSFVKGAQIYSNVEENLSWDLNTGNLIFSSTNYAMSNSKTFESFESLYMPSLDRQYDFVGSNNTSEYYTFTKGSSSSNTTISITEKMMDMLVVDATSNYSGGALRVNIEFFFPYVEINDIYQLVQYIWFTSDDTGSDKIFNYYLKTYETQIKQLIDAGEKQASTATPVDGDYSGAWCTEANWGSVSVNWKYTTDSDAYYIEYNGANYYILLEKYCSNGDILPIYSSNNARLTSDIVLDKYTYADGATTMSVDFGFNCTSWKEYASSKKLDGQKYSITIVASDYNHNSGSSLGTTSKWAYVKTRAEHSGSMYSMTSATNYANNYSVNYVPLQDIVNTPGKGSSGVYIYGGFLGIIRGEISNVNFILQEYSLINIVKDTDNTVSYEDGDNKGNSEFNDYENGQSDSSLDAIALPRSVFAGVVAGYITGKIDGCSLTMEQYSQIYVNKFGAIDDDNSIYHAALVGGYCGLLGNDAQISNSTLVMNEGVNIGVRDTGIRMSSGLIAYRKGDIRAFAGGFAGMMVSNSLMYNLVLEGDSTSKIFAFTDARTWGLNWNQYASFNTFASAAGGVVGCNTSNKYWNTQQLSHGLVDGVIFNWAGASISMFNSSTSTRYAAKEDMSIYYIGGNIAGVVGDGDDLNFSISGNTETNDYVRNLYYVYELSSYKTLYQENGDIYSYYHANGSTTKYITKGNGSKIIYIYGPSAGSAGLNFCTLNSKKSSYIRNSDGSYSLGSGDGSVTFSGNSDHPGTIVDGNLVCVSEAMSGSTIINARTLTLWKLDNESVIGTGISYTGATSTKSGNNYIYESSSYNDTNFKPSSIGYKQITTGLSNIMSWADTSRNSNVKFSFEVDDEDTSSVMWAIDIYKGVIDGNSLRSAENTISEIPVYAFATSLQDSLTYKKQEYTIIRGQGDGMKIMYCTGSAASLSPNKTYYTNEVSIDKAAYYATAAIMYDGSTDAANEALTIYDSNGNNIERLEDNIKDSIVTTAKNDGDILRTVYKQSGNTWNEVDSEADLTAVGYYKVIYEVLANEDSYGVINPNAYVNRDYRTQFFSSDGSTSTYFEDTGNYLVETYTLYVAIAPVYLNITEIKKVYDGSTDFIYKGSDGTNYSSVTAQVDQNFAYAKDGTIPPVSCSYGVIKSSVETNVQITLDATYDNAEIGNRSITLKTEGTVSYVYWQKNSEGKWIECSVESPLLKSSNSSERKAYFSLTILNSELSSTDGTKTYGYKDSLASGYTITNGSTVTSFDTSLTCKVHIDKANAPTITVTDPTLSYVYTGKSIEYGVEWASHITITDQFGSVLDPESMINNKELTITGDGTAVKDVKASGYTIKFTIAYTGTKYGNTTTESEVTIFVTPALLTITKAVKEYDGKNDVSVASFAYKAAGKTSGLYEQDKITFAGTYASSDVSSSLNVKITTSQTTINGTQYKIVGDNYYLENDTINGIGVIYPTSAEIVLANKDYDKTNTVTYTGSGDINKTSILIKTTSSSVLGVTDVDVKPNATYSNSNVGNCNLQVSLNTFTYVNEKGASVALYRLEDSNYCIENATSTSYTATGKAYIIPVNMTISYIYKTYDGTTAFPDDDANYMLSNNNNEFTKVDGSFSDANVKYENNKYNDINVSAVAYTYMYVSNDTTASNTVYRVQSSGSATNYTLNATLSGSTYVVEGIGVIIPKLVTIKNVTKLYDGKNTFDTAGFYADKGEKWEIVDESGASVNYHLVGTMGTSSSDGKNATNGKNLYQVNLNGTSAQTPCVATFTFNGVDYIWLHYMNNTNNNYYITSTTIAGIGDVLQRTINVATSGTGTLSSLSFTVNSKVNTSGKVNIQSGSASATYLFGQYYSIDNLTATFNWSGSSPKLSNGKLTVDGSTLTFKLKYNGSDANVTNAGSYTFTLSLVTTSSNFAFNDYTIRLTINKRALSQSEITVTLGAITKVYDGTDSTDNIEVGTPSIKAVAQGVSSTENVTLSGTPTVSSLTATDMINVKADENGEIQSYDATAVVTLSNFTSTNYTFSGSITTSVKYKITPYELTLTGAYEKEFNGTSTGITLNGINSEIVEVSYSGIGTLPGTYSQVTPTEAIAVNVDSSASENNKDNSIPANYTINVGVIDLTIKPATIIAERQYGADSFNVAVAITNLEGFDFLKEYKDAQDAAILSDTIVSDIASNLNSTTYKTELKSALIAAFAIRGNNAAWTNFETSNISSINIYSDTLEFIFTGLSELDTTSLTDRYSFAMYNNEKKTSGSNIAISSSELSDGQYTGTYTTTGTAVSTAEELVALINGGNDGYLTNNIYGFDATSLTTTTYSGTLYGNGYSIVLSGNFNISETSAALFIPTLQGNLYDINFKYATNAEINEELTSVGLVVNTNNGTISNCSLELLKDLTLVKDEEGTLLTKATVGGFANTSTGTLTNVTIVYSASETYSLFAGLAYTASGTINYVSARNSIYTTSVAGKTMFNTLSVTVDYAIDAITFAHTTLNSGSITTIYDTSSTYLAFYENNYTDGYLDYYFTLESKYTTDNAKHNEYVNGGSDNTNTTYYKDYRTTTSQTPILAIEVIAPLGDFIWAAFGVDYTEYKTNLNRAVGIFNTQDELTSITSYTEANNISYTIFKPIIGAVAGVKIAAGIDTIIEKEYSGSVQKAEFASEDNTKTFVISGTEVGTYTTYLDGASSEGGTAVSGYDVERFIAEIVTGESGEEKIMLIITPKQLTDTPTITKEYDSTTIAETELKAKDTDAAASLYAVGEYSESKVGIGYNVSYYSTTKAVAAVNVSGTYKFITYRAYNTDENGNIVYIVEFIDIDGANFTSATNVTTANVQSLARAYYQLVTVDQISLLAYKTYEAGITQDNITSVYVYDLTFSHTVDSTKSNAESSVVYGTEIYYTNTVYNIGAQGEKVYNKNYNYLASTSNTFTGVSIMASTTESTSTSFVVSNEGSITKRTINANFSNLDQSYRTELSSIGVEIGEVSSLTNIPHSLSSDDLQTLISNINTELESAEFTEDILATVSADYVTKDNGKYYATQANTYVKVKLENPTTPISVSNNLAVTITGDNYLTLRYFAFDKESNRFMIDTFEALLMIDNLSDGNNGEYQTLDYIVTNDLYGRSQLVTTFTNEFSGTIEGNSKTIKNFVLVGNTSTGLFGTLSNTASIEKLTFAQVLVIASDVASMSVVSTNNNGSLDNIKVEAEFVSDKNATVKVVANNNSGTTTNSTAFVQTSMVSYSVEAESSSTNDIVVLERTYNVKNLDNIITKVTINGLDTNSTTSSAYTLSDISENVINLAILGLNNTGLTIENKVVKINNFREYWAYVNICPFLSVSAEDLAGFIGVEFEI